MPGTGAAQAEDLTEIPTQSGRLPASFIFPLLSSFFYLSPMLLGTYDIMMFDGDCGVCSKAAEFARRMARRSGYAVEPYQRFSEEELRPFGVTHALCARRIQVITRSGKTYAGAFAVNHFCWRHGWWRVIPVMIYIIIPLLPAEIVCYKIVARNRMRISRWLGLTACAVPASK